MAFSAAVFMSPAAFFVPFPTAQTWGILFLSMPAHWLYQTFLVRSLSRGDLSLVFPVMRGSAPLLTALAAAIVLREHLSAVALSGLAIASLATVIFALPEKDSAEGAGRIRRSALLWALATGGMVAVYNVIDTTGVRVSPQAWSYIVWLFLIEWIGINTINYITKRKTFWTSVRVALVPGILAGALSLASFSMALYGFSLAPVAYISAMRETSVVFAALMGWWFLKEGFGARRTIAALLLVGGLSLLQLG